MDVQSTQINLKTIGEVKNKNKTNQNTYVIICIYIYITIWYQRMIKNTTLSFTEITD